MDGLFMHQRANGLQRKADIDLAEKNIDTIPCPDSETSLHLRIYLTCDGNNDYLSLENIINSILDKAIHQKIWITFIPALFGTDNEADNNSISKLVDKARRIERIDQIGIAFDSVDTLLNNTITIDFYGILHSIIRKNQKHLDRFKHLDQIVYAVPDPVVESSRYIETLDACRYHIMMVEYSSYEENRLLINDHGFIYQIKNNQII